MGETITLDDIRSARQEEENNNANTFSSFSELEDSLSMTDDQIAAKFAGQKDLGDPGLENISARFALADADTANEKLTAFKKHYPEGSLQVTPVTGELVFREDPSKPFRKVDAGVLQKFEPVADIVDFFGSDIGSIIGELALSKGSGSILRFMAKMFLGGSAGEVAQQGVQEARGVNEQGVGEVLQQGANQGAVSAVGGGIGYGVGKVYDAFRGAPVVSGKPGADDAIRAGKELGLEDYNLTVGEYTDNPILQKLEAQAAATLPTVSRYIDKRTDKLTEKITGLTSPKESSKLIEELSRQESRARGEILGSLGRSTPKTRLSEGGQALTDGITAYSISSQRRVADAYKAAKSIEEPVFNIASLKADAKAAIEGLPFKAEDGAVRRAGEPLDGATSRVANQILDADENLPAVIMESGEMSTSVAQLRAWRSALWDAKTPNAGEPFKEQHRAARDLYNKIDGVLKNPANTSKEFREAYEKANRLASERFDTLDKIIIKKTAKGQYSDELAKQYATPNSASKLRVLRGTISSKKFNEFQDSFKFDLLENSKNITNRLDSFDKETLNILMTGEEQRIFRTIGKKVDSLNRAGIGDIVARQSKVGSAVKELIERKDSASVSLLYEMVEKSGGKKGVLGTQLRAGLLQHFADRALIKEAGVTKVSQREISNIIADIRSSGLGKFLTTNDMALFANMDKFLPFVRTKGDFGVSLLANTAASNVRGEVFGLLTGQGMKGAAFQTVLENIGVGILFTKYAHVLRGMGTKKPSSKATLGLVGSILSLAANEKDAFDPTVLEKLEVLTNSRDPYYAKQGTGKKQEEVNTQKQSWSR